MGTYAFAAPILPGKTEEFKSFAKQMFGEKKADYAASRKRAGITREALFLQPSPMGDFVVVIMESHGDPAAAMNKMLDSKDPFDRWFFQRIGEIHGITREAMASGSPNSLIFDWRG
jgi:L-rhamnose mutarotase